MNVLVTGGAHRLGGEIARGLSMDGATVAIHYHRSDEAARRLEEKIASWGGKVALLPGDLSDVDIARGLARRAAEALGGTLDLVVNSAATFRKVSFADVDAQAWSESVDVNLRACFFVTQGAAEYLRASGGSVINMSDIAAFDTWSDYIPHSVAKAGVESLTRLLALELAPEVRVNAIAPGAVMVPDAWGPDARQRRAERAPLKKLGDPGAVLHAVRYLIGAQYVTGTTMVVDGGQLLLPRDRLDD